MTSMNNTKFSFKLVSLNETLDGAIQLIPKNTSQATDKPVKNIKENKDLVSCFVFQNFNLALSNCSFPTALKYADVRPSFKNDEKIDMESLSSKVYERLVWANVSIFSSNLFETAMWFSRRF